MKFKYYLRGAGVGMIIAAIIMTIAFSQIKTDNKSESTPETTDHGETVQMANEADETEEATGSKKIQADEPKDNGASNDKIDTNNQKTDNTDGQKTSEDTPTEESTDEEKQDVKNSDTDNDDLDESSYKVTIISGEVSNRIAERLESLGLVEDGSEFNNFLEENKIDHSLRPGTYIIKKGLTYEEIANILMKK